MILNSSLRENLLYGADEASNDDELINLIDEFKLFNEDNLISLENIFQTRCFLQVKCKKFHL